LRFLCEEYRLDLPGGVQEKTVGGKRVEITHKRRASQLSSIPPSSSNSSPASFTWWIFSNLISHSKRERERKKERERKRTRARGTVREIELETETGGEIEKRPLPSPDMGWLRVVGSLKL